jgi:hypothetical protein
VDGILRRRRFTSLRAEKDLQQTLLIWDLKVRLESIQNPRSLTMFFLGIFTDPTVIVKSAHFLTLTDEPMSIHSVFEAFKDKKISASHALTLAIHCSILITAPGKSATDDSVKS